MFDSKYISGVTPALFDKQIDEYIADQNPGGGGTMLIAIENEAGQVYRNITTYGMGSFMGLATYLRDVLNLHDKLYAAPPSPRGKPDAHFQVKS
ncbi:hypothetical protein ACET7O_16160 [Aeromonas veronii]|uniref:hypothetical protein n=1 Tax=Aeromonas enteropelogenes TaxID=29489 RepID=UPI0038F0B82A